MSAPSGGRPSLVEQDLEFADARNAFQIAFNNLFLKDLVGLVLFEDTPPDIESPLPHYTWINLSMYPRLVDEMEPQGYHHLRGVNTEQRKNHAVFELHVDGDDRPARKFRIFAAWERGKSPWWFNDGTILNSLILSGQKNPHYLNYLCSQLNLEIHKRPNSPALAIHYDHVKQFLKYICRDFEIVGLFAGQTSPSVRYQSDNYLDPVSGHGLPPLLRLNVYPEGLEEVEIKLGDTVNLTKPYEKPRLTQVRTCTQMVPPVFSNNFF